MAFQPKFNAEELISQFKSLTKPAAKERKTKEGISRAESTRISNVSKFPNIVALHEYIFITQAGNMEPHQLEAYTAKVMDIEYPRIKNTTGKMEVQAPWIRCDAEGNAMMDANGNPLKRSYDKSHYKHYVRNLLCEGKFNYYTEMGLTDDDVKAAMEAWAPNCKKKDAE